MTATTEDRTAVLHALAETAGLKVVMVDNLGRDAIALTRYGLLLVDPAAIDQRAESLLNFFATPEDRQAGR